MNQHKRQVKRMNDLTFSITLNNRTFNIQTNNRRTICSYVIDDTYKTSLVFASNTYANVKYKNTKFSGTVTKQNNWYLSLDMHTILQKRYNILFFETTKQNAAIEISTANNPLDYSESIFCLYDLLTKKFSKLYSAIENKAEFKNQLCAYLEENYYDVEDLNQILEYENYADDDIEKEPYLERITVIDEIINNVKELFSSFRQAELDGNSEELDFILEETIKEVPELRKIPHTFLSEELKNHFTQYNEELTKPDIYYNRADRLYNIGKHLYDAYQYSIFINTLETRINKILSTMDTSVVNKEEMYLHFKMVYDVSYIPNDKEFAQSVKDYVRDYTDFYNLYNKFVNLFDSDNIKIVWDNTTIQLFEKYDKKEISIDPQYFAEYEVYRYVIPYYRKYLFRKNSNKYKPVIEKLPDFISYATSIYDILFKHNILIDTNDKVRYNEEGDIKSAYEEIAKI